MISKGMNWITVLTRDLPQDAYVPRSLLESRDIPVNLTNEIAVQIIAYLSPAVGGVSLQVPENRVEEARSILRQAGYLRPKVEGLNSWELQMREWKSAIPGLNRLPHPWSTIVFGALLFLLTVLIGALISMGLPGQKADAGEQHSPGYFQPEELRMRA